MCPLWLTLASVLGSWFLVLRPLCSLFSVLFRSAMFDQLSIAEMAIARPLYADLGDHLIIQAVLDGTSPGQVYVDDRQRPAIAFISSAEGHYLVGSTDNLAVQRRPARSARPDDLRQRRRCICSLRPTRFVGGRARRYAAPPALAHRSSPPLCVPRSAGRSACGSAQWLYDRAHRRRIAGPQRSPDPWPCLQLDAQQLGFDGGIPPGRLWLLYAARLERGLLVPGRLRPRGSL